MQWWNIPCGVGERHTSLSIGIWQEEDGNTIVFLAQSEGFLVKLEPLHAGRLCEILREAITLINQLPDDPEPGIAGNP